MNGKTALVRFGFPLIAFGVVLTGCASSTVSTPKAAAAAAAKPQIYDSRADGEKQLAAALSQAQRDGKRVLLNLGANWCSDSQAMYRLLQDDPGIVREIAAHYVLVLVDVNKREGTPRNARLVARFGEPLERGIPALLVLAADGTLLNTDSDERLADDDHQHPARVLAYLRKWSAVRP